MDEQKALYCPVGGAMRADGEVAGEMRYYPFGEVRTASGSMWTDQLFTGQRALLDLGIYHYNARFYSPYLKRFLSADTVVPGAAQSQAYDRYAYVENNPISFIDPDGFEKVIIIYGTYEHENENNSFLAAASTQYQKALDAGYSKEDILMVQISTDTEFFDAIAGSDVGEIEQIHVFSHGWAIDYDGKNAGGLQLSEGNFPEKQTHQEDFYNSDVISLQDRFSQNAAIYLNACQTAGGTVPQLMADAFNTTTYAYKQNLKFFETVLSFGGAITTPFTGNSNYSEGRIVEMSPSIGYRNLAIPLPINPKKFTPSSRNSRLII